MNLLLIALACLFATLPQDAQKPAPPAENMSAPIEAELRELAACVETSGERLELVKKSLDFGQRAAKESDATKSWVMYRLAVEFADQAGEARISHSFTKEMVKRWHVPSDFLFDWYIQTIKLSNSQPDAKAAELAWLMAEDAKYLTGKAPIAKWESIFKSLRGLSSDAESEHTKRVCVEPFSQIKAWLWIAKESANDNIEAEAFRMILSGDVAAGIERLEHSDNAALSKLAKKVGKSESPFAVPHLELLESLANSRNEAARLSAKRIFESWLPTLNPEQIGACQSLCYHMTESLRLRDDFSLPYHGLLRNGYHPSARENTIPKGFSFDEAAKQWICKGEGTVEWPRLPFENYFQEIELTIDEIGETTKLAFGSEDSVQVRFRKDKDRIQTRLLRHSGGRNRWRGSRSVSVGEKLVVRVYRTPERMFGFINGKELTSRYFGLGWHKFRITVGKNSQITVSNIKTRPWLPGDREVLGKLAGEFKSIDMTKLQFRPPGLDEYRKYFRGFDDLKFKPEKGMPFVTEEEIVMQPVAVAKFQRPGDERTVSISKAFHCSAHEITQRQFTEIMEFNPSSTQGNPHFPVDNVTMIEAIEFCARLDEAQSRLGRVPEGYEFRLPTEAEWTLAARADGKSDLDVPKEEFWHWETCEGGFRMVGTSSPSKRGLFDMHGNVEELTLTEHHKRKAPEETQAEQDEEIVDHASLPDSKSHIVIKGGSWNLGAHLATSSRRERRHQGRTPGRGFRVVLGPAAK